jgi:tRNA(Arg) A34 adenosine deaminase TadA
MNLEQKMMITIAEARKSLVNREFPVGAVIFDADDIISQAHSSSESTLEFLPHAEIAALLTADKLRLPTRQTVIV